MYFSIITITYNAGEQVVSTVESVLRQNYTDYEYIFVDGASTDNTTAEIEKCIVMLDKKGIPHKYISEKDKGISDAFNKGIKLAEGEVVVILNAGDEMLHGTLAKVKESFTEEIDVLYGDILFNNEEKNLLWLRKSKSEEHLSELKYAMVMQHPATYIRKRAYDKYGVYDISYKYCMDEELLYRYYLEGAKFKYVNHTFTKMRAGGASDSDIKRVLKEGKRIPIKYGDSKLKINLIYFKKLAKYRLAHIYRNLFFKNRKEV